MVLKRIEIEKAVGLAELDGRLRNVRLKGFPDVKIYEDADIAIRSFSPDFILRNVFTPQPSVYRNGYLDRVEKLADMFIKEGIDIFRLREGIDYRAVDENGAQTRWTMIPPVVEVITVNFGGNGLDYSGFVAQPLKERMEKEGHRFNPELASLAFSEYPRGVGSVPIICDGSHRIHVGVEGKIGQNVLLINAPKMGFPYYAAPKPYSAVHVLPDRPEDGGGDKTHVLTAPGHKLLYRLFPSGGILNGDVRTEKVK